MSGSPGSFVYGELLTANNLNAAFALKQDFVGNTGTGLLVNQTSPTLITPNLGTPSFIDCTNAINIPTSAISLGVGVAAALALPLNGAGALVATTGPILVAPKLGTPASGNLTNCTALPIAGIAGLGAGVAAALALVPTGTGAMVLANSPALVTPNLGTPAVVDLTNATAPTRAPNDASTAVANTAFVTAAIISAATGVISFNGRIGAIVLTAADITGAGGAPIASPALTGTPTAPTAAAADNTTKLATTAYADRAATAAAAAAAPAAYAFRNRIINGDMRIDQRNVGNVVALPGSSEIYFMDRWASNSTGLARFSANRAAVTGPFGGAAYTLRIFTTTAAAPAAADLAYVVHPIEGVNVADLAWGTASAKPVTLSFWVTANRIGLYSGALLNAAGNRSYVFTFNIAASNTYTFVTITIPGDTAGVWATDIGRGISLFFNLGTGATRQTATPGVWLAGLFEAATGSVAIGATVNDTLNFTDMQLEAGSVASPFERRLMAVELQLCQRYFCKSYSAAVAVPTVNSAPGMHNTTTASTGALMTNIQFQVEMRAPPAVSLYSYDGTANNWLDQVSVANKAVVVNNTATRGAQIVNSGVFTVSNFAQGHFAASAEL